MVLASITGNPSIHTVILNAFFSNRTYPPEALSTGIRKTVRALRAAGKRVIIVGPHPVYSHPLPAYLAKMAKNKGPLQEISGSEADFQKRESATMAMLRDLERNDGVDIVSPERILCRDGRCMVTKNGKLLYFDANHLSMTGARLLVPAISERLR